MPELPEIETIRRGLNNKIINKKIVRTIVNWQKSFMGNVNDIKNKQILAVERYGKLIQIKLSGAKSILIHLKLTGQLVYQSKNERDKIVGGHPQKAYNELLPHKHTHVYFEFNDGSKLYFNDLRKFGYIKIISTENLKEEKFIKTLGIDALSKEFNGQYLSKKLSIRPKSTIYQLLLDQTVVSGVGNIYANEALYYAGIRPDRINSSLSIIESGALVNSVKNVLKNGIKYGGASDNTYRKIDGSKGEYLDIAAVYHKKNDPKGHQVINKKINGRTAHYCSICQQ